MPDNPEHRTTPSAEKVKSEDVGGEPDLDAQSARPEHDVTAAVEKNDKEELNDSEAETEILSGSRRQTPRKPSAIDTDGSRVAQERLSPSAGREKTSREPSSPIASPKKRKVDEVGEQIKAINGASSDDDEDDVVVRRTRIKRARKTPQSEVSGAEDGVGGAMSKRKERIGEVGPEAVKGSEARRERGEGNDDKNSSLTALDLSSSLDVQTSTDQAQLQSPRLRAKFHRRSISHHPSASTTTTNNSNGQSQDSMRRVTARSRGSEGPPPTSQAERSTSQPATGNSLQGVRVDAYGLTTFHKACKSGDEARVRQMLQNPSVVSAQLAHPDYAGNTPLHSAALKGHANIIRILLEYDVDVNASNNSGDTPLQDATDNDHDDVVELLQQAGGTMAGEKPAADAVPRHGALYGDLTLKNLIKAIRDRDGDKAQAILNGQVIPNQDCIVAAIEANNLDMLEILPACGAPTDDISDSKTPMVRAIEVGNNKAVNILLANGADASRKYPEGSNLHYWDLAAELKRKGWQEVCQILRKAAGVPEPSNAAKRVTEKLHSEKAEEFGVGDQMQLDERTKTTELDKPTATAHKSPAPIQKAVVSEPTAIPAHSPSPQPSPMDKSTSVHTGDNVSRSSDDPSKTPAASPGPWKEPSPPPAPPKEPTPPPKEPTPPPPLPELPPGLAYALSNPLPVSDEYAPYHCQTLMDGYNAVRYAPLWHIDPGCPEDRRTELWCPNYQISAILGHPDLQQLKGMVEERGAAVAASSSDANEASGQTTAMPTPRTMPLTEYWRDILWRCIGLWQPFSRRYKYDRYPGTATEKEAFARRDGFTGLTANVLPNGKEELQINYGRVSNDALKKWMALQDGTQTFWLRLEEAKAIVEEEQPKQERLKHFRFFKERLLHTPPHAR